MQYIRRRCGKSNDSSMPSCFLTFSHGLIGTYTPGGGWEGNAKVTTLKLEQCQCDSTLATQTLTFSDGSPSEVVPREVCQSYIAACGRCALDAAATSTVVNVIGAANDVSTGKHMEHVPGFEIAIRRL